MPLTLFDPEISPSEKRRCSKSMREVLGEKNSPLRLKVGGKMCKKRAAQLFTTNTLLFSYILGILHSFLDTDPSI